MLRRPSSTKATTPRNANAEAAAANGWAVMVSVGVTPTGFTVTVPAT